MALTGKIAIVTGGARGIGFALGARLAAEGAAVVLADVDVAAARASAAKLAMGGRRVIGVGVDVADAGSAKAMVGQVVGAFGGVDILVNNAGIAGRSVPLWELTDEDWHSVVGVDLTGVFHCSRAVVGLMIERGWGRIVNIASIAGKEGNPNAIPYSSAKAGVIGFTKALAKEVATKGILVNCVTPAVIETDLLKQVSEQHIRYMLSKVPMGRPGQPEEVAALVAWLCSDECSFSTGAVFDLSGGRATY